MRRRIQLLLLLFLIAGTTETGIRASTDCERWISAYKAELAHAKAVKKMQAAQARLKRAAKRKLAHYVKKPSPPKPKPMLAHFVRPRLTRQQILDRFNLLCGDLPSGVQPLARVMDGRMAPGEFAGEMPASLPAEIASTTEGGSNGFIPPVDTPVYPTTGVGPGGPTGVFPGAPPIFGGGGPPIVSSVTPPPVTGPPSGTDTPIPPPVTPPISAVPEPGSLGLLLTGVVGAAGVVRRRLRA